jgi:hypothetical protein
MCGHDVCLPMYLSIWTFFQSICEIVNMALNRSQLPDLICPCRYQNSKPCSATAHARCSDLRF